MGFLDLFARRDINAGVTQYQADPNGVLLDDEVTEFCNREMHNVVLSLDGRKAVHDRLRKNYAGQGS